MTPTMATDAHIGTKYRYPFKRSITISLEVPEIRIFIHHYITKLYTNGYISASADIDTYMDKYKEYIEFMFIYLVDEVMMWVEQVLSVETIDDLSEVLGYIQDYGSFMDTLESYVMSLDDDTYSYIYNLLEISNTEEIYTIFKNIVTNIILQIRNHLHNVNFNHLYIGTKYSYTHPNLQSEFMVYVLVEYW